MYDAWVQGGRRGEATYPLKLLIMSATLRVEDFTENKRCAARVSPLVSAPAGVLWVGPWVGSGDRVREHSGGRGRRPTGCCGGRRKVRAELQARLQVTVKPGERVQPGEPW